MRDRACVLCDALRRVTGSERVWPRTVRLRARTACCVGMAARALAAACRVCIRHWKPLAGRSTEPREPRTPALRRSAAATVARLAALAAACGSVTCTASCDNDHGAGPQPDSGAAGSGATRRGDVTTADGGQSVAKGQVVTQRFNKIGWGELNKAKLVFSVPLGSLCVRAFQYVATRPPCNGLRCFA